MGRNTVHKVAALAVILLIVSWVLLIRHSAAQEPLDYGDDFIVVGGDYTRTGFTRTSPVLETYYPLGAPASATSIQPGVLEWNDVTNFLVLQFTTAPGAPASHLCGGGNGAPQSYGTNGVNDITWAPLAGSAIGRACWWVGAGECDIVLDSTWAVGASPEAVRTVVLHEVGHCVGLGHSSVSGAVMYPSYSQPLHLHADDRAGICVIYGCTIPNTPTPTSTVTPTPTKVPLIYRKFLPEIAK